MPVNYRQAFSELVEKERLVVSSKMEEIGPEHDRRYRFTWLINENASDTTWMQVSGDFATTKASARELASKEAFEFLEIRYRNENV
ncbi:hypothetical protein FS842_006645 [Serendipita sp. 407]|nr:hypothetical protein FRC18_007033 [Serendipita sp. 400]KAG9021362.1 hypothetical protein FS842_006645 [Serendipita sp. 407]